MPENTDLSWQRFQDNLYVDAGCGLLLDLSGLRFSPGFWPSLTRPMQQALAEMRRMESGGWLCEGGACLSGHFWLRDPALAPTAEISGAIMATQREISGLAEQAHRGRIRGENGGLFSQVLVIGMGGSCQGTRFVSRALATNADKMRLFFLDNIDPNGRAALFAALLPQLPQTLVAVVSQSGATVETLEGRRAAATFFQEQGLDFSSHAISISCAGSPLDVQARAEGWLACLAVPHWVGGRFSVCSAVGLLPLALQGVDTEALLIGAARMDARTRADQVPQNPAALLAGACYSLTGGQNHSQLVLLPYRDSLEFWPGYLQQLLMESLGKEYDRAGRRVCQGLTAYGNKGSSDQHSYMQQLLAGPDDFCAVLVEVLGHSGDHLAASLLATRNALSAAGRRSLTVTLPGLNAASIGALLALWERAVGLYASLLNLNAYDQPAVEQIKLALPPLLALRERLLGALADAPGREFTVEQLAAILNAPSERENIFKWLRYLAANPKSRVGLSPGADIWADRYYYDAIQICRHGVGGYDD